MDLELHSTGGLLLLVAIILALLWALWTAWSGGWLKRWLGEWGLRAGKSLVRPPAAVEPPQVSRAHGQPGAGPQGSQGPHQPPPRHRSGQRHG